jgi:hypothetical protein
MMMSKFTEKESAFALGVDPSMRKATARAAAPAKKRNFRFILCTFSLLLVDMDQETEYDATRFLL